MSARRPRLIQEQWAGDPWKVLIATMFCQRAKGTVAEATAKNLFVRYRTAREAALALNTTLVGGEFKCCDDDEYDWLTDTVRPLGFQHKRAATVARWAHRLAYDGLPRTEKEVATLPGAGLYTCEVYRILVLGLFFPKPTCDDGPLNLWWHYTEPHFASWQDSKKFLAPTTGDDREVEAKQPEVQGQAGAEDPH